MLNSKYVQFSSPPSASYTLQIYVKPTMYQLGNVKQELRIEHGTLLRDDLKPNKDQTVAMQMRRQRLDSARTLVYPNGYKQAKLTAHFDVNSVSRFLIQESSAYFFI